MNQWPIQEIFKLNSPQIQISMESLVISPG